jgi:D-sedoheptulose 7-phosphate isomerase
MESRLFFKRYFDVIAEKMAAVDFYGLQQAATAIRDVHKAGGKVIVVGNGGSAAIASHIAVDFTKAAKIRAINFNEADLITCYANDYGYDQWVVQALQSYADKGDLAILISSSGKSPNIVNGARKAKEMGLSVVTLSGFDANNPLRASGDINLWVESSAYNAVEMSHLVWLLSIVDYLVGQQE